LSDGLDAAILCDSHAAPAAVGVARHRADRLVARYTTECSLRIDKASARLSQVACQGAVIPSPELEVATAGTDPQPNQRCMADVLRLVDRFDGLADIPPVVTMSRGPRVAHPS
jgi:hypothetical protein